MITKEVIEELEKMNLRTEICRGRLIVIHNDGEYVASVSLVRRFEASVDFRGFRRSLSENERTAVYFFVTRLAATDLGDRGEEQKYYLEHKWLDDNHYNVWNCLNFQFETNGYSIGSPINSEYSKTQFTQAEIDEIKEKLNTNLDDFEQVPIEDRK